MENTDCTCNNKIVFDHAWIHFKLHARQRIMLMRFYVAFLGIFVIAAGFLMIRFSYDGVAAEISAFMLSAVLIFVTIIFWLLDKRNTKLIHLSEDAFRQVIEKRNEFKQEKYAQIFINDEKQKPCITHTRCFRALFIGSIIASVIYIFITAIYLAC